MAPAFFRFTTNAFLNLAVLEFCKILDKDGRSASLYSFLDLAKRHTASFRGTSDKTGWPVEEPQSAQVTPEEVAEQISQDYGILDRIREEASHLSKMRNKTIAHNDQMNFKDPNWLANESSITIEKMERFFQEVRNIIKKYLRFLTGIHHTDYLRLSSA